MSSSGSVTVLPGPCWFVRARHIQCCLSVIADCLSRPNQSITIEWSLHPETVSKIFEMLGFPTVDMFATVHNTPPVHVFDSEATSTGSGCTLSQPW